jgi:UDP-N-acetylglucosamine 1-carboxyvinyltransferase
MSMIGVRIEGMGTSRVTVHGGGALKGGEFRFDEDFHEITTFLALGAITGGDVVVRNSAPDNFPLLDRTFAKFGVQITARRRLVARDPHRSAEGADAVHEQRADQGRGGALALLSVDLLPIFIALGVRAQGNAMFWNKVYDGALGWTGELSKFGAHVFSSTRTGSLPSAAIR